MNNKNSSGDSNANELAKKQIGEKERIFIGAIGAGVVGVASYPLFSGYLKHLLFEPDLAYYLGFLVRLVGFLIVGGFWAYLHKDENNRLKVFQTGTLAPAMLALMFYSNGPTRSYEINTVGISNQQTNVSTVIVDEKSVTSFSIISPAHAQSSDTSPRPSPSFLDKFIRGLWGK